MGKADAPSPITNSSVASGAVNQQAWPPINVLLPERKGWRRVRRFLAQWEALVVMGAVLVVVWVIGARQLAAPITVPTPILKVVGGSVLLVVILGGLWVYAGRPKSPRPVKEKHAAFKAAMRSEPSPSLHELLAAGSRLDGILQEARDGAELVDRFKETKLTGAAIRMSCRTERLSREFEPLCVPFEPTPLNRAYARLLRARPASENRLIEVDFAAWAKAARQVVLALRGSGIAGGLGAWLLPHITIDLMAGRMTLGDVVRAIVLVTCLVVVVVTGRVAGQLYLIPGGLIDVRRKNVYRRSTGSMIWCPDTCMLNVLTAANGPHLSFTITPAEAELALRAWLSPVPSPSDELIESFLKGRA